MAATTIFLFLVWLALTGRVDPVSLAMGGVCIFVSLFVSRKLFLTTDFEIGALFLKPVSLFRFLAVLAVRLILSTAYTVRLILFGREESRIVALPIRVQHPLGQLLLLNAITLTPSTISLLLEGDLLYIHWLRARHAKGDWRAIKEALERRVLALFPEESHDVDQ